MADSVKVPFVSGIFSCEPEQWGSDYGKVLDVRPEEVAQSDKGANRLDVIGMLGSLDCFMLVLSGLDSFWGKGES
jgi:hypothetical protein